jgi:hypothetical protein
MKTKSEARLPARPAGASVLIAEGQLTNSIVRELEIDLLGDLRDRMTDARRIMAKAEATGGFPAAVSALRELIRLLELYARLTGQFRDTQQVNVLNVHVDPETGRRIAEVYLQRHGTPRLEDNHEL